MGRFAGSLRRVRSLQPKGNPEAALRGHAGGTEGVNCNLLLMLCLLLSGDPPPASLGCRAQMWPFAKPSSRSHERNFFGDWLFPIPPGSCFDVNSPQASDVNTGDLGPQPDGPREGAPISLHTAFPSRGHQREVEKPDSRPLLQQPLVALCL